MESELTLDNKFQGEYPGLRKFWTDIIQISSGTKSSNLTFNRTQPTTQRVLQL